MRDLIERLRNGRCDLSGLPTGAAAHLLAQAKERLGPMLVVAGSADAANRFADNLRFFCPGNVLHFPTLDTTPYLDVAPDRRAAMDRMAVLFHLSRELPWSFVVTSGAALVRKVPPRDAIRQRSRLVKVETELEREDLIDTLSAGGYVRVPVAEDPGTFAVRGGIVDVYPAHARFPARIELDDWIVESIKLFDPDDQRTIESIEEIFIHPVRDTVITADQKAVALKRVRELCDEANVPTTKTRALLDDLEAGRAFYGVDGLLPAFYDTLESPLDYLPPQARVAVLDPTAVRRSIEDELDRADMDRQAKVHDGAPAYPLEALYSEPEAFRDSILERQPILVHKLAVGGAPDAEESALAVFESVDEDDLIQVGGFDQTSLVALLKAKRAAGAGDGFEPVIEHAQRWVDEGFRVLFTARTRTQADRLASLLKGYGITLASKPADLSDLDLNKHGVQLAFGTLHDGFIWPTEARAVVTEEEIFGTRARRRRQKSKRRRKQKTEAFLEDLRELNPGDHVVHADHGIGIYRGIERKTIAQSAFERMRGEEPRFVEVLVVEYKGDDKLFLPVTRLSSIQKFSGEGAKPKLDKLGGTTFAKKKAKVRTAVKQMADELLKLYAQRAAHTRKALPPTDRTYAEFEATFPFEETNDQARAIEDVLVDLEEGKPMDRLVCGDVGFGKTEVAMRAAFRVAMDGRQVAVLCPTTVLAQQHFLSFRDRFEGYPLEVSQLSRFVNKATTTDVLGKLKAGSMDVVVGTHRLLSKDVHFKNLGLLVVDEEQRFGVAHKERIKQLRTEVDVLTLTATPIPRTLQMAIGGLRDLSLITTPPVDRRAVRTFACRWDDHNIREAIGRELNRGGQVFFVYNRIEGLYERAQRLQDLLPGARICVAHGQMKEGQLERTMTDFVAGDYDVLCSTAIIESGLDIPRANTMIIDRADMFGLAQLYQLRGRVGRSRERAYCYLITPPPSNMTDDARTRIEALERFTALGSGFQVASLDMEQRGVGDLLGAEQSGNVALIGFDLFLHMLEEAVAQLRGEKYVQEIDPELTIDLEHYLPDDYISDVGLRLSFYKRLAGMPDEDSVQDLASEMEDRFGPPPPPALTLVRAMMLRPGLKHFRALGCQASAKRVTLHLRQDTPLDPAKVVGLVGKPKSPWSLSPDMKLTYKFDDDSEDAITRVDELLKKLRPLQKSNDSPSMP